MKVGVLALQGAFAAHVSVVERLGARTVEVRRPEHLADVDALIIPGGESTTLSMGIERSGMIETLRSFVASGAPVLGTCAGAILLAQECLDGRDDQIQITGVDVAIRRNAFGRQVDSFEADVTLVDTGASSIPPVPFPGVFIRAPAFERLGESVEVVGWLGSEAVAIAEGSVVLTTFHPELTTDTRLHALALGI
ncbi:MAG: pyridoxal 5'-phosphate synthase glutaminase subunit PdxT [Actinobacteria bacterium]|nr:pyridoxal 5'-phosphate synthase glutaminase subunit PdxT [Actinomycetota bacterium]